jgi:MYXO-CTERM domain-containing protein
VSPAGGNPWVDNGDGTFTTAPTDLTSLTFSPLDLYLMGLVPAEEVPPFVFLRDVVAPAEAIDPFRNRTVSTGSFPWQGPGPLTVTATAETLTIDDIIEANGVRSPAVGVSPTEFTVGVVIVAASTATDDEIVALQTLGGQRATAQAAAFARATGDRASIRLVSSSTIPAPAPTPEGEAGEGEGEGEDTDTASGCSNTKVPFAGVLLGLLTLLRRRRAR